MIKKILCAFMLGFITLSSYANIHIKGEVATRILRQYFPDVNIRKKVIQVYNSELKNNIPKNTISAESMAKICDAAGWDRVKDKNKRTEFRKALLNAADDNYTYYEVCGKDKGKSGGTEHCVDNVFYALVNGIDVQLSQAMELSKEYALVKYNDDVECSSKPRSSTIAMNDYIKCTSKLNPIYYEFKFDDVNENTNGEIYKDVIRGVGNIHDVEFRDPGCSLVNISRDTRCVAGYKTTDKLVCDKLSNSLKRFGMGAEVRNVVSGSSINDSEVFCAVSFMQNNCTAAKDYGIDDAVFKDVQYPLSPTLENYVKDYVTAQLKAKNINVSSFECDKVPERRTELFNVSYYLTCRFNNRCIRFPFEDLSEGALYSKNASLSKLACIKFGGRADQENCRGLNEEQCDKLGQKIKASGKSFGTHYDKVRGGCILNASVLENQINLLGEIAVGVALTVITDGATTIPVIVSVGADFAFDAVRDWQRMIPYKDYQEFIKHVASCIEDSKGTTKEALQASKTNSVENKYCLAETIKEHYKLVVGQMSKLAPEDQKILSEVFANIIANIGDDEYIRKASESELSLLKQGRNFAQVALLGGLFFFHPTKVMSKFDDIARDIARLRYEASKNFTKYLDDFKRSGKSVGLPIQRLSRSDWQLLNKSLADDGIELFEQNGYMVFRKLNKVVDINSLLYRFNKTPVFRSGSTNTLGHDYYRIVINDTDNVEEIVRTLRNNGYYVSANQTVEGQRFIAASTEDVFHSWENAATNWLRKAPGFHRYGDFYVSNERYSQSVAKAQVDNLQRNGYYATIVPTKGVASGEEYVVSAIKRENVSGLSWDGDDLVKYLDNSTFLRNLDRYRNQEIARIGKTSVFIEDVGSISGRGIVTVRVGEKKIPFYVSTGTAGKTDVPTGKWEVFWGIGENGWFNKGTINDILNHYNSPELRQIARALDNNLGDPRNVELVLQTVGRNSVGGVGIVGRADIGSISRDVVNSGFSYAPASGGASREMSENIKSVTEYLRKLR